MPTKMLTAHVSYKEATKSHTAIRHHIDNTPSGEQLIRMKFVSEETFEVLRVWWNDLIGISSFFRCAELNELISHSSRTSQHMKGEAIDIDADMYDNGLTNKMIFDFFYSNKAKIKYDQLIYEYGNDQNPDWVHISKVKDGMNRVQTLRSIHTSNGVAYTIFRR